MRKLLVVLGLLGLVAVGVVVAKKMRGEEDEFAAFSGAESFDAVPPTSVPDPSVN